MIKKKIYLLSIILVSLLGMFVISSNVKAQTETLPPHYYWGVGKNLNDGDTLNFQISSSNCGINVYIMNSYQFSQYQSNPQDTASYYYEEWLNIVYLSDSFDALDDDTYYVLMINPDDIESTSVTITANIDYAKSITIQSPRSTDTFENGYNAIRWSTTGSISIVRIELYIGYSFVEVLESWTSNDGFYDWYISSNDDYNNGSNYRIRISDYDDDSISTFSDYFTIEIEQPSSIPSHDYRSDILLLTLIALGSIAGIVLSIVLPVVLVHRKKKRKREQEEVIKTNQRQLTSNKRYCQNCGKIVEIGKEFCVYCGKKQF